MVCYTRTMTDPNTTFVSVDVLPLRFDHSTREVMLATYRRPVEPFEGHLALPGVLLLRGERLQQAGLRALRKVGARKSRVRGLGQLVTFDEPNRDPRGPTLSITLWAGLNDEPAPNAEWMPLNEVAELGFDHNQIVERLAPRLAGMLWSAFDPAFTRALTGETFTAGDAVALTASLLGKEPDRGNLNRTLAAMPGLERTTEKVMRSTGRPGAVWAWK